jgi:phosphohistidine phosphatase
MDLILWRHAEAEDGFDDMARALTPKGKKQAAKMAQWLTEHIPQPWTVIASPARRTQETVSALNVPFETNQKCRPGAHPDLILDVAGWPYAEGSVIIVGHQPTLGLSAALALTGQPYPWSVRKGAIIWLTSRDREGVSPVQLRACLSPDLIGD